MEQKKSDLDMDADDSLKITSKQFEKWKRRCSDRSADLRRQLFEASDSSDSESELREAAKEADTRELEEVEEQKGSLFSRIKNYRFPTTIDPYSDSVYLFWQFLVATSFTYNACCIPVRMSFPFQTDESLKTWLIMDYLSDFIYLIDITVFQVRCQYIDGGDFKTERKDTRRHYLMGRQRFRNDFISLLPTDLLYIFIGVKPACRLNRLFKYESFNEFNSRFEMVLKQAYVFRVMRTTCYLLYFIHLDACLYYYASYAQNFETNWGYLLVGHPYIRCFYWAFVTTVTIGNVESPTNNFEYVFQLTNFFLGLFIFSIVIGQVRDSVHAATAEQEAYRRKKNACTEYMQTNNIPASVQKKVRLWFQYTWETQKILDENAIWAQMPVKMHTEIAINCHISVLDKVELFKECDRQLLNDLVLKLRPVLYLPGDYICKKGEIGREMYIISHGIVQVVGESSKTVFATLHPGTAFGEISLLAIGGANRRTANIYSPGFTTLFILYKNDLNEVVKQYPLTQMVLRRKAKQILKQDNVKKAAVIEESSIPPSLGKSAGTGIRLLRTMMQVASARNKDLKHIRRLDAMKNTDGAQKEEN